MTTRKKKSKSVAIPTLVASHIEDVRVDGHLHTEPARVDVNAPLALIQAMAEGHLQGIGWMLRQPMYAVAPELLAACKRALNYSNMEGNDIAFIARAVRNAEAK